MTPDADLVARFRLEQLDGEVDNRARQPTIWTFHDVERNLGKAEFPPFLREKLRFPGVDVEVPTELLVLPNEAAPAESK